MNKESKKNFIIALSFIFIAGLFAITPLQGQARKLCCISGKYEGFQVNYARPNCPRPQKENFTMVVKQKEPCAEVIGGTVTDSSGVVNDWTGTLSRGLMRGCCALEGSFLTPSGNTVKFKGTICLKLGKWQAKGTWEEIGSTDPCRGKGTWQMSQI